jgi:FkbM family methyltransferase
MAANHLESDPAQGQLPATRHHDVVPHATAALSHDRSGPVYEVRASGSRIFESTDNLLSRARMQWQFGDWRSLSALDLLAIEHHPGRAELALLSGCAALQVGQRDAAKRFLAAAESWGCHPELMARLLVAGVANSLGRYHALKGNSQTSEAYFLEASSGLGGDPLLAARARQQQELLSLQPALEPEAISLGSLPVLTSVVSGNGPSPLSNSPVGPAAFPVTEAEGNAFVPGIRSYAQNFEDVMLWRALKHVENGFYIDVGAQHPIVDSVSKAFYERGWRGIHVEAIPAYAKLLRADRPDEIVIEAALSSQYEPLRFFEIPLTGMSTGDSDIALNHKNQGYPVRETVVPTLTLSDVFALVSGRTVHWLKIDVEGMEQTVLEGWGANKARPWIVVVESTYPNKQIETHSKWEGRLLSLGYEFAYRDGLSRFYVHQTASSLRHKLTLPPNVFDGFSRTNTV